MTIRYERGPAPEYTLEQWEQMLQDAERRRANGLAGEPNADGSRTLVFDDGEGLDWMREMVAEMRNEVDALEALL